jgi:hypothetical protein
MYPHAQGDGGSVLSPTSAQALNSPSWPRFTVGLCTLDDVEIAHRQIVDLQRSNSRLANRKTAYRHGAEGESAERNRAYGHCMERRRSRLRDL